MSEGLQKIIDDLKQFIEYSQLKDDVSWQSWISATVKNLKTQCWEQMQCNKPQCPAYGSECGRCWLIAGTLCDGQQVDGENAQKHGNCCKCKVYQNALGKDSLNELQELLLILVYNLRSKHRDLKEATEKIKVLHGLLPVCASCKKIRDEQGRWQQMEIYLADRSEASFTHGMCPDCIPKYFTKG